ncbi:MAG: hypothetical protein AAFX06_04770 [Planctomycetota bacterium]
MFRYQTALASSLVVILVFVGQGAAKAETISLPPPPADDVARSGGVVNAAAFQAYQARLAARSERARAILRARFHRYASDTGLHGRIAGVRHTYVTTDRIGYVTGVSVGAALRRQLGRY